MKPVILLELMLSYILNLPSPAIHGGECLLLKKSSHKYIIQNIITQFKKHSGKSKIKTLEDKLLLQQWLNKHTNIKPIFWFSKSNNMFKVKAEHIKYLTNLMQNIKT